MCSVHNVAANYLDEAVVKLKVEVDHSAAACKARQLIVKDINDYIASGDHIDLQHTASPDDSKQCQLCICCQCSYRLCI